MVIRILKSAALALVASIGTTFIVVSLVLWWIRLQVQRTGMGMVVGGVMLPCVLLATVVFAAVFLWTWRRTSR